MRKSLATFYAVLLLATANASAAAFQRGDLVIFGTGAPPPGPPQPYPHEVRHYSALGLLQGTLLTSGTADYAPVAFDSRGMLYAIQNGAIIKRFDALENQLADLSTQNPDSTWAGLTFDAAGTIYVSAASDIIPLTQFDAAGSFVRTLRFPGSIAFLAPAVDLAADQCTLYGTSSRIERVDVCTASVLPPITTSLPLTLFRLLPNGSILMAGSNLSVIDSTTGAVLRQYGMPATGLALDETGAAAWISSLGTLYKVDLASGLVLQTIPTDLHVITSITVFGERRAASGFAAVPTINPAILAALAIALALLGARRL